MFTRFSSVTATASALRSSSRREAWLEDSKPCIELTDEGVVRKVLLDVKSLAVDV